MDSSVYSDIRKQCQQERGCARCSSCEKLWDLELKIQEARRILESLLDERAAMGPALNSCHDPFSHRLPVEIASRIFEHCKSDPSTYSSDIQYEGVQVRRDVITLGGICKNWRNIAHRTPALWNVVCATFSPDNYTRSGPIVHAWLTRSGVLPLFVQLAVTLEAPLEAVDRPQFVQQSLAPFVAHSSRIDVLDLDISVSLIPLVSTFMGNVELTGLNHFKYALPGSRREDALHLQTLPRLLTKRLGKGQIIVQLHQLTQFSGVDLDVMTLAQLIHEAPNLTSCTVTCLRLSDDLSLALVTDNLSLRTLNLAEFDPAIWQTFNAPSLENLRIDCPVNSKDCWILLSGFIRRSGCHIKELAIIDIDDDQLGQLDAIQLMPNIERLELDNSRLRGQLFHELSRASPAGSPKPLFFKLTSLTCKTDATTFQWGLLIPLLATIKWLSLKSFKFSYEHTDTSLRDDVYLDEETLERLLDALNGVDFEILTPNGKLGMR